MRGGAFLLLSAALLAADGAAAELPRTTRDEIDVYRMGTTDGDGVLAAWEDSLKAALASADPDKAADRISAKFGLSRPDMRELVGLWLVQAQFDSVTDTRSVEELRARLLALVAATGRAPLVLQAAAAIMGYDRDCDAGFFDALLKDTTDPAGDGWLVARTGRCAAWFRGLVALAPGRSTAALIQILGDGSARPHDALPVYEWLTGEDGLSHLRQGDRASVSARLNRDFLNLLLETGLLEEAIALFDRLPEAGRGALLAGGLPEIEAEADGMKFRLPKVERANALRTRLAIAFALKGRAADAEALFASLDGMEEARRSFACVTSASPGRDCTFDAGKSAPINFLDHFLHRQADDPYPLAETYFGSGHWTDSSAAFAHLKCRLFAEPQYGSICKDSWEMAAWDESDPVQTGEADESAAAIEAAGFPRFAERKRRFADRLAEVAAEHGGDAANVPSYSARPSVDPLPSPFEQRPIPAGLAGKGEATAAGKGKFGPLPEGFEPVRVAQDGDRAAVISVSQNYDPTGEVSRGGYWVHLSDDGGRTWKEPLYTGLAEFFPYVVEPSSALPLFDGDSLNVAVEIRQIDTASITYPPIGLRTKRRETGLYLKIGLAELARDSDGDGLTDIVERHLLLDAAPAGNGEPATPMVVGANRPAQCASPSPERDAIAELLGKIFSLPTRGIIEPVDSRGAFAGIEGGWRAPSNSADRPIFVRGDPRDYACLRPDRLMIVYSDTDIARLRRFTPDFHAVSVSKIIFNRARDRGYVVWSGGWTGGTMRLNRVGESWSLETISGWIS